MLRQTLAASVLNCMKYNFDNGQKTFWGYEIGKTYLKVGEADEKTAGIKRNKSFTRCYDRRSSKLKMAKVKTSTDFYTVKGIIENLFEDLEVSRRIKLVPIEETELAKTHKVLHPYRTAVVLCF